MLLTLCEIFQVWNTHLQNHIIFMEHKGIDRFRPNPQLITKFYRNVLTCSCAMSWSFAHSLPMDEKLYLWNHWMDFLSSKFYRIVLTCSCATSGSFAQLPMESILKDMSLLNKFDTFITLVNIFTDWKHSLIEKLRYCWKKNSMKPAYGGVGKK